MKRSIGMSLLNAAAVLVALGGLFDMLLPAVPDNLAAYLLIPRAELSPQLTSLILGLLRALGGSLLAVGLTALILIHWPAKRGERWAGWTTLLLIGVSEGINASQMWRFGSPFYAPLGFVALAAAGLFLIGVPPTANRG